MSSRGDQLYEEVMKMEKKKPLFGKRQHQEKTTDKMLQCANAYRAERNFPKAGELYAKAAKNYEQLEDIPAASRAASDAVKMYSKDSQYVNETLDILHHGVDLFKSRDRHCDAADLIAESVKIMIEEGQKDVAIDSVNEAYDLYRQGRSDAKAGTFLENSADLLVEAGEYAASSEFYLQAAKLRLESPLTQGSSGGLFVKSILTFLQSNDIIGARHRMTDYLDSNPAWRTDMAYKFVQAIIDAIEAHNIEQYDAAMEKFKALTMLNKWLMDRVYDLRGLADGGDSIL